MFKKRINLDDFMGGSNFLSDMKDGDVYQIIQKGKEVKVVMTQEYYFQLMAKLEKTDSSTRITNYDPEILMTDFAKRLKSKWRRND